jgi:ER membrane protein complex subunit 1
MQYIPFLLWSPLQILSVNTTLPAIETILSSSSHLESTSLVLSYGIDIFFTRATPSKGFDMLASDFNKPLLALIVGGMAVVVWLLKNYNSKRILNKQWL